MYNDTSGKTGLMQDFEFLIGTEDARITGNATLKAQVTNLFNRKLHQAQMVILNSLDGWNYDDVNHTDYPILTGDLVANQQSYVFGAAEKIIKIDRVEVTYDGTNWYKAEPLDINEIGSATDTTSNADNFSTDKPYYDMRGDSLYLYPTPTAAVTGGIKIWIVREPDEFTTSDTTQEPGIDEAFHRYISLGAAVDWAVAKKLPNYNTLKAEFLELEGRMKQHYSNKIDDTNMQFKPAYINYD